MTTPTHGQTLGSLEWGTSNISLEITDIRRRGAKRETIDCTSMAVQETADSEGGNFGNKIKVPSIIVDPGQIEIDCNFSPGVKLPLVNAAEIFTLQWGPYSASQRTEVFVGFLIEPAVNGPLDGKPITTTLTIEVTDVQEEDGSYDTVGAVQITLAT